MDKSISFLLPWTKPPTIVHFVEVEKENTEEGVFVVVAQRDRLVASTGFDAPACCIFSTVYELGTRFSGRLYQGEKIVGDIGIGKDETGLPSLNFRVGRIEHRVRLEESDIARLKALFAKVGEQE